MNRLVERLRDCAKFLASDYGYPQAATCEEAATALEAKDSTIAALTAECELSMETIANERRERDARSDWETERDEYKRRAYAWQEKGDALDEARESAEARIAVLTAELATTRNTALINLSVATERGARIAVLEKALQDIRDAPIMNAVEIYEVARAALGDSQ